MFLTADRFNQGMTAQEYLDQIKLNKQAILDVYNGVETPTEDRAFFDSLAEPLRLAVFTADWCGDALTTTPTILRLAGDTAKLDARVFDRDKELEMTNSYLPPHRQGTVPVFVVLDSQMREVSRFIETAKELVPALDAMEEAARTAVAPAETGKPMSEMSEASSTAFRGKRTAYRVEHAREWGQVVAHAFTAVVKEGMALPPDQRPAEGGTEWPPPQS